MDQENKILAIIPAYNEARRIGPVIRQACEYLPVLVVDDGSVDETATIATQAGAQVARQVPNQGKGAALRRGFREALDGGYRAVITLDADGQHDPQEIAAFLLAYRQQGDDLIIGKRDFSRMPGSRRLANTLGTALFSWAMGQSIADNQSGYRLISRELMEAMLSSSEQGFEFEVEMIVTAAERGMRVGWVPIRTIYAGESSHIQPLKHVTQFLRVVLEARQRMRRQRGGGSREGR